MAGTRIKTWGTIPAAANETVNNSNSVSTAAAANAWLQAFEDTMLAAGFVRTADTGQLTTISAAISSGSVLGYRIYALNDEYSSTSPLYLKVQFGGSIRGINNMYYRLRALTVDVGLSTDGAGSITGNSFRIFSMTSQEGPGNSNHMGSLYTVAWRKDYNTIVVMQPTSFRGAVSNGSPIDSARICATAEFFIGVSRVRDRQGNISTDGFMCLGMRAASVGYGSVNGTIRNMSSEMLSCRISSQGVVNLAESPGQVLSPVSGYSQDPNSLPIVQYPITGRNNQEMQYPIEGVGGFYPSNLLVQGSDILVSDPAGGSDIPYKVVGVTFSPLDVTAMPNRLRNNNSSSVTVYPGDGLWQTDVAMVLDWSD